MVGIAIVSHSAKLAEGLLELAKQMVQAPVKIAAAAGIDDPENPYGTDALQIVEAIESVYDDEGVVVLMDLGSAILSAEMALELLPEDMQQKVKLCPAPIVEGTISATVQAAAGADMAAIVSEAEIALMSKVVHLSEDKGQSPTGETISLPSIETKITTQKSEQIQLTIRNNSGLHARPAAKFVTAASQFSSAITLQNLTQNSSPINAKSINQVITLAIKQNDRIAISATGYDASAALIALQQLVEDRFGEEITALENQSAEPVLTGLTKSKTIPASPGIAIGPVIPYRPSIPAIKPQKTDNAEAEWQKLQLAIETVKQEIAKQTKSNKGEIFEAHRLILEDPIVLDLAKRLIFQEQNAAAPSWQQAIAATVNSYQSLQDSYFRARAADVEDVGNRVLRLLAGANTEVFDFARSGIIVARDLPPSEASQLKNKQILGVCLAGGSPTSHSALLANIQGIPMVVGAGSEILSLQANTQLALDGSTGEIWIEPTPEELEALKLRSQPLPAKELSLEPITRDGYEIPLMANILGLADSKYALESGAKGVGLLRTEFLYLDRSSPPTEAEQLEVYRGIAEIMGTRPLIIRTLDIGGDKPVNYLKLEPEANPFLGWRGIRQSIECRQMLKTQLKAILQASPGKNIKIMLPMVATLTEVRTAKQILGETMAELNSATIDFEPAIPVGITIEVPAAVIMARQLAREVDFFSIGTNDLSQYIMAADRTNAKVASLADALAPPVLRAIKQTVVAAKASQIKVAVCGQIASEPVAVPILLGLGVDELSINPPAFPTIIKAISELNMTRAKEIAAAVLELDSARSVREYVATHI